VDAPKITITTATTTTTTDTLMIIITIIETTPSSMATRQRVAPFTVTA
jgi:hypothetical protein